ncbi:tetratricopeptide repeat protein [Actinomycetes bacterium KLBMP 9797]
MAGPLTDIETLDDLGRALRHLRRREARERCLPELTYRELAAKTGWSVGAIGGYFSGKLLPSTTRFDTLIRLLGATPVEQGTLATARDRVGDRRPRTMDPAVPHQLPADAYGFTGRDRELDTLMGGPALAVVSGTAGVGKTALAVHWAHRVADRFPDGQLYANLRGFDPRGAPLDPAAVARGFLLALGTPAERIPADLDAQTALYRSTLATRRVLVLLDNAHDAAQVRPLLPGAPGSVVVVTSRNRLTGLVATDGARPVTLGLLSAGEAREMLARRLGDGRVAAEPAAVADIVERCSRLPLALAIAAARAATDADLPLAGLAAELAGAGRRLDALGAGDAAADVRTLFSWSYRALPAPAARMFRLLGRHPGPDIGVAGAASLTAATPAAARASLVELTRASLLTEYAPGRFTCHDLLREYAAELAHGDGDAAARVVDHYARTGYDAGTLVDPTWEFDPPAGLAPGVRPEVFADRGEALAWFTVEYPVLLAAVRFAAGHGFDDRAYELTAALGRYQELRAHWQDWADNLITVLAPAERLGDRARQARLHRDLISTYAWSGRHETSVAHAGQAIALFQALGDDPGQARCHRNLCLTYERLGQYRQALEHARASRDLLRGSEDRAGVAYAYNSVGWYHALVGEFPAALTNCRQAIPLLQECGDRVGEGTTWDSLGYAHHHLGEYREAVACYERALALFREYGDRYYEADTLDHLGDTLAALGDHDAARAAWHTAVAILDDLGRPEAANLRPKLTPAP